MIDVSMLLDEDEIDEFYYTIFDTKEQFIHKADPKNTPKAECINKTLVLNDKYTNALILYVTDAEYSFTDAVNNIYSYRIYDNINDRDRDFEQLAEEQALDWIDESLTPQGKRLCQYVDKKAVIEDYKYEHSYAEVLSSYEKEYECTIYNITYYIYKE